jgi:hypothetical protein
VPGKEYRRVSHSSIHDAEEGRDLTPPAEGFELYRYKDAEKMRTKGWHGYYWAKRTEGGDYEILALISVGVSVPSLITLAVLALLQCWLAAFETATYREFRRELRAR